MLALGLDLLADASRRMGAIIEAKGRHYRSAATGVSKTWGSLLALGGLIGLADA